MNYIRCATFVAIILCVAMLVILAIAVSFIVNSLFTEFWERLVCVGMSGILCGVFLLLPFIRAIINIDFGKGFE